VRHRILGFLLYGAAPSVVLYEDSCISTRDHSGGSVTPHPVSLMSYPWIQSGLPYRA
jgi:hypothetical protein